MQIQVNSDNHIQNSSRLEDWIGTTVQSTLEHYEEDLTRVEVHLKDENGDKPGTHDKRCQMEARPKGHQPVSVTHTAATLDQAVEGAATKLNHALEHLFGKLRAPRRALNTEIPAVEPLDVGHADDLLEEEFLAKERALNS